MLQVAAALLVEQLVEQTHFKNNASSLALLSLVSTLPLHLDLPSCTYGLPELPIHMHMIGKVSSSGQQEDISAPNQVQFLSNYYTKVSLHGSDYKNVVVWLPECSNI